MGLAQGGMYVLVTSTTAARTPKKLKRKCMHGRLVGLSLTTLSSLIKRLKVGLSLSRLREGALDDGDGRSLRDRRFHLDRHGNWSVDDAMTEDQFAKLVSLSKFVTYTTVETVTDDGNPEQREEWCFTLSDNDEMDYDADKSEPVH